MGWHFISIWVDKVDITVAQVGDPLEVLLALKLQLLRNKYHYSNDGNNKSPIKIGSIILAFTIQVCPPSRMKYVVKNTPPTK